MSTKKWLVSIVMIGLFSQSVVWTQETEKMPLDTTRVRVDKIDKEVYSEIEDVEIRGLQKGKIPLAKELFPDDKLVWTRTFEGRMTDCAIAEKSGHVVIGGAKDWQGKDWQGFVYLFGPDGQLLWKKESSINSDIKKCGAVIVDISDNGRTIGMMWCGDFERQNIQGYDISGERTLDFCGGAEIGSHITISPQGRYIDCDWGLYARDGEKIELRKILQFVSPMKPTERCAFAFASDSEIVVRIHSNLNLYFFSFPNGQLRWKRVIETSGQVVFSNNYILLGESEKVTLCDKKGNLLWTNNLGKKTNAQSFSFSKDEGYIGIHSKGRYEAIMTLDIETGKIENNIKNSEGHIDQFPPYFVCSDGVITISGISSDRKGYHTYFLKLGEDREVIDKGWRKGLVIGTSASSFIGAYESDATDTHPSFGENSTKFTINILERRER